MPPPSSGSTADCSGAACAEPQAAPGDVMAFPIEAPAGRCVASRDAEWPCSTGRDPPEGETDAEDQVWDLPLHRRLARRQGDGPGLRGDRGRGAAGGSGRVRLLHDHRAPPAAGRVLPQPADGGHRHRPGDDHPQGRHLRRPRPAVPPRPAGGGHRPARRDLRRPPAARRRRRVRRRRPRRLRGRHEPAGRALRRRGAVPQEGLDREQRVVLRPALQLRQHQRHAQAGAEAPAPDLVRGVDAAGPPAGTGRPTADFDGHFGPSFGLGDLRDGRKGIQGGGRLEAHSNGIIRPAGRTVRPRRSPTPTSTNSGTTPWKRSAAS